MILHLPCECSEEEHEITVDPEVLGIGYGIGYNGIGKGDKLSCGRVLTQYDEEIICELIHERVIDLNEP